MSENKYPLLRIWLIAHEHLRRVSEAYKARGENSKSMTALSSEAILQIPMPNGSEFQNHETVKEEEKE